MPVEGVMDVSMTRGMVATPTIGHAETVASTAGVTDIMHTPVASTRPKTKTTK